MMMVQGAVPSHPASLFCSSHPRLYTTMTTVLEREQLADCFKLLAVFFYEPEIELWEEENILKRFSGMLEKTAPEIFPLACRMREAAEEIDGKDMAIDYAALFVGPFELPAPPYGSVYLDKMQRVMGDSTMMVLDRYREAGLKVDVQEPPDHIAIELEFIHFLLCAEIRAARQNDREEEQRLQNLRDQFLSTCLVPWIHPFCERIIKGTTNPFYTNLALCLEAIVTRLSGSELSTVKAQCLSR